MALLAVHAVWTKLPAVHDPQGRQVPPDARYALAGQLVHRPAPPLQVAQLPSHALQTRSLLGVQVAL